MILKKKIVTSGGKGSKIGINISGTTTHITPRQCAARKSFAFSINVKGGSSFLL